MKIDYMTEEFISESITPVEGTFDTTAMARAEPGLPGRFTWRDNEYTVAQILKQWKESGPCKSGSSEVYLRKHWFKIITEDNMEMTIYFQRQSRTKKQNKKRWWLYTVKRNIET